MTAASFLLLQSLTNLGLAPPARVLPTGWRLVAVPGAHALTVRVTRDHVLRLEGTAERAAPSSGCGARCVP